MLPFEPLRLGDLQLRNRVVKAATFEGMTPGGVVTPALVRHHRDLAAGGVGMTTLAYCAVASDGRTFGDQLWMREEARADLSRLCDAVHAEGAAVSVQLGHCGGFSKNKDTTEPRPKGPSWGFNAYGVFSGLPLAGAMTKDDIARVVSEFVAAATMAKAIGFNAVELHLGHGYLLSQFLSPGTNRRGDEFGGSLENRARFPVEVVRRVRDAVGPGFPVLCKTNLRDGFPGGLEIDESVEIARMLERAGATGLVLSGGFVSRDAMYLFRGEAPLADMIAVEKSAGQKLALRLFGPAVVKSYPFEPLYFLPLAKKVREAVTMPLALLGGVKSLADLRRAHAEGFELVQMGRALIHEPDLIARYQRGESDAAGCAPCNRCVAEIDREGGVVCPRRPEQLAMRERERAERAS